MTFHGNKTATFPFHFCHKSLRKGCRDAREPPQPKGPPRLEAFVAVNNALEDAEAFGSHTCALEQVYLSKLLNEKNATNIFTSNYWSFSKQPCKVSNTLRSWLHDLIDDEPVNETMHLILQDKD